MKSDGKNPRGKPLLLVSGDRALQQHIAGILGLAGIPRTAFAMVTCGRDALKILAKNRPRLLILDNDLPDTTGLELLRTLRHDGSDLLVVYTVTHHTFKLEKAVRQLGVLYYTEKPPDPTALKHIVAMVFSPVAKETHPNAR